MDRRTYRASGIKLFRNTVNNCILKATVTGIPVSEQYTGQTYKPVPVVKMGSKVLTEDVDYTVSYSNNRNVGTVALDMLLLILNFLTIVPV